MIEAPVVFLDFDGVLNRSTSPVPEQGRIADGTIQVGGGRTWRWLDRDRCAILEDQLVHRVRDLVAAAGAAVVVSSDWRVLLSLGEIGALLAAAGWPDPPLADRTDPKLAYSLCRRYEEVADWLRRHGEPPAWVALDDQWGDRDGLGYPVVEIDPREGVTPADAEQALVCLTTR